MAEWLTVYITALNKGEKHKNIFVFAQEKSTDGIPFFNFVLIFELISAACSLITETAAEQPEKSQK